MCVFINTRDFKIFMRKSVMSVSLRMYVLFLNDVPFFHLKIIAFNITFSF